ncbi:Synaptic vesicle membrane protein VAT-1 [Merluccius polli]|uniref:Synaptic vesicle membrane protein VAT-1 n=1 Tax=Merluccius polli TaxID=89951 RepID=A0AA47PA01_MERPO|nr:Synaptic vesicle membrane protein VAT-1 [Merluccius polli]
MLHAHCVVRVAVRPVLVHVFICRVDPPTQPFTANHKLHPVEKRDNRHPPLIMSTEAAPIQPLDLDPQETPDPAEPSPPADEVQQSAAAPDEEEDKKTPAVRALVLTGHGGYDKIKLQLRTLEEGGVPARDQVLVRVKACGLNFAELMGRQGLYDALAAPPVTMGMECAGVVEAVGEDVAERKVSPDQLVLHDIDSARVRGSMVHAKNVNRHTHTYFPECLSTLPLSSPPPHLPVLTTHPFPPSPPHLPSPRPHPSPFPISPSPSSLPPHLPHLSPPLPPGW